MLNTDLFAFFTSFDGTGWLLALRDSTGQLYDWVLTKYTTAPALVLGVCFALLLPVIATIGAMLRSATRRSARKRPDLFDNGLPSERTRPASAWRQRAWLERADGDRADFGIRQSIVRIGRETDNDLCLADPTVHRYHAVLEQTPEAEYIISYVGDPDSAGLLINGRAARRQRLRGGEVLEFGAIKLRFALSAV